MPVRPRSRFRWLAVGVVGVAFLLAVLPAGRAGAAAQGAGAVPVRDGDVCIACGAAVGQDGVAVMHRGRRVPMCPGACEEHWRAEPDALFADLQPRSALFQEAESRDRARAARSPWFWVGLYVLAGLVCSAAAAYLAVNRAQPPLPWFFAGLAGNVAALVVLVLVLPRGDASRLPAGVPSGLSKVPLTRAPRPCTSCGAPLHPSASACPDCGASVVPLAPSEVPSAG